MSCTRVLHALGSCHQPAMAPLDFAMTLSRRRSIHHYLPKIPVKPSVRQYQPMDRLVMTSPHQRAPSPSFSEPRSCFRRDNSGLSKKRVVFADAVGRALTAVRLFIPETTRLVPTLPLQPPMYRLPRLMEAEKTPKHKLRLGFPQPTADMNSFLARLRETHVQLESCSLSEHLLSGRVRVFHVSSEKIVNLKVTFDSWKTHHDVPCAFQQHEGSGAAKMDVFTFDLSLPKDVDPNDQIEFCVSFRPGHDAPIHWDNNRGQRYSVHVDNIGSSVNQYSTLPKQSPPKYFSADLLHLRRSHIEGLYAAKYAT